MTASDQVKVTYDARGDVLYIARQVAEAVRGVEDPHGIVWRYDEAGDVIGATILDFAGMWADRKSFVVEEVATRFDIPARQATLALSDAMAHGVH